MFVFDSVRVFFLSGLGVDGCEIGRGSLFWRGVFPHRGVFVKFFGKEQRDRERETLRGWLSKILFWQVCVLGKIAEGGRCWERIFLLL